MALVARLKVNITKLHVRIILGGGSMGATGGIAKINERKDRK